MDHDAPSYRSEFMRSPHHGWLGLLTLGVGFVSGHVLPLIAGATAYSIGWIYLPDMAFFRGWVDRRRLEASRQADLAKVAEFTRRRDALLESLSPERLARYQALSDVCRNIEAASVENPIDAQDVQTDPRLRKLDELMWTYLRLLTIEQMLERFIETESREQLPMLVREAEHEVAQLKAEIESLKAQGGRSLETKERYLASREDRLDVLRKRFERSQQAQDNLALVLAEQERLDQQIKLIRADAVAMKNAGALTARIDATVEHLDQTNRWLSEMSEFKDLAGDLPQTDTRVGFSGAEDLTANPPPLPGPGQRIPAPRPRLRQ